MDKHRKVVKGILRNCYWTLNGPAIDLAEMPGWTRSSQSFKIRDFCSYWRRLFKSRQAEACRTLAHVLTRRLLTKVTTHYKKRELNLRIRTI